MNRYLKVPERDYPLTAEELSIIQDHIQEYGYGLMIIEELKTGKFLGDCSLTNFKYLDAYSSSSVRGVEIGYHLTPNSWGQGYATEAAMACLEFGFRQLDLREIHAFTRPTNTPSIRVLEKLGMKNRSKSLVQGIEVIRFSVRR